MRLQRVGHDLGTKQQHDHLQWKCKNKPTKNVNRLIGIDIENKLVAARRGECWWVKSVKGIKSNLPTPVFLPGESQGRGSLVGCRLWGRTESDTTEVT